MPRGAKRSGRTAAPPGRVDDAALAALLSRLRELPAGAPVEAVRAAAGDEAAAVPAAASALAAGDEGAEETLATLARVPEFAPAAIQALGRRRSEAAAAALRDIAAQSDQRETVKAARRALHALESQGIHVELPSSGREAVFRPPPAGGIAWQGALAGPIDAEGQRSVLLAQATLPVGATLAIGVLSERLGLALFHAVRQTHRQLEKEWREYLADRENNMAEEIPFGYAQWLLSEAAERTRAAGAEVSEGYTAWREATGGPPADTSPRFIYEQAAVDPAAPAAAALQGGAELLEEPELATWTLPLEALTGAGVELAGTRNSPLVLSEAAQVDRERQLAARVADEHFTADVRQYYRRRLEETGLLFLSSGRGTPATVALANAAALGDAATTPSEVPFAVALARRSLEAAAEVAAPTTQEGRMARSRLVSTGEVFPPSAGGADPAP